MKKYLLTGFLGLLISITYSADKKHNALVTIGKLPVSAEEFKYIYERNNNNVQDPENKKNPSEYLQLFINFKLKVLEAQQLGLDTTADFKNELAGYRKELALPYLTDFSYDDNLVRETYRRMTKEVNASHILIFLPENFVPADTLEAFEKITGIRKQITEGLNFNEAAIQYSQDPSVSQNRGDLGWFSAFQMVYPFENAAFTTPVGQLSKPFRTRFGYHLLKTNDIRDAQGEMLVSHIMMSYPNGATPQMKESARLKADSIYNLLRNGAGFAELAMKLSDDKQSAADSGKLPWFGRSYMISAFSDPAFSLKNNGDISKPVDSGFGYHIIRRLDHKPVPAYDDVKNDLQDKIKKDSERSLGSRIAFINKLKSSYRFTRDQAAVDANISASAGWFRNDSIEIPPAGEDSPVLFTFAGSTFRTSQWADYLRKMTFTTELSNPQRMKELYESWENETVLAYEDSHLEQKHPEFGSLMQEYHDGMLLFTISDSKIWQRASNDSTGLAAFYEKNKNKYLWDDRYKGSIIRCYSPEIKEKTENYLEQDIPVNEITDILGISPNSISITEGIWSEKENPVIDYYFWKGVKPDDWDDATGIVKVKKMPPEPKLLNEARGYHIADYQQYLEDKWIEALRKKYPVKINKKILKTLGNGE